MLEYQTGIYGLRLSQVLPQARFIAADDVRVASCTSDSRKCREGDLFVALAGSHTDGLDHLDEAINRGARAVLTDREPPGDCSVPVCVVPDCREAFGLVCQALAGNPSQRLKVIGVTGTNGKTTTSHLIAGVLDAAGHATGILGTLGYFDGVSLESAPLTTPSAPALATWLARMEANGCTHAVMETSSHAIAQRRIAGVAYDAACITNLRHDHLDYHQTVHEYHETKIKLLDQLTPEGFAVVNADDEPARAVLDRCVGLALSVGIDAPAEITAQPVEAFQSEQTFLLSIGNETMPVRTPLIGRHNIENCLIAAAVGFGYGIDLTTIAAGLESVSKVPGRLERIECGQPFGVFVDYAHTADALSGCLSTLRPLTKNRLLCVFGAGGDRDRLKRPRMGRAVESHADLAVVTTDNPRNEDPIQIIDDVRSGFRDRSRSHVREDRGEAIRWVLAQAQAGDCVLIAGKGHERYQCIGDEQLEFDDREIVRECLYDLTAAGASHRASA